MDGLLTGVSSHGPYHWDRHPQARTIATTIPVKTNSLVYRATIYFNLKFAGPVS